MSTNSLPLRGHPRRPRKRVGERITQSCRPLPRRAWAAVAVAAFVSVACTSSGPQKPADALQPAATSRSEFDAEARAHLDSLRQVLLQSDATGVARGLTVRLAFEGGADLDLFVTDPDQESVYFANSPTRSGGTLLADRRCEDPAPRIETVQFPDPRPGRYRVGVDFPRSCAPGVASGEGETDAAAEALYLVRVEEGGRVLEREGTLALGLFEVIAIEFDVAAPASAD